VKKKKKKKAKGVEGYFDEKVEEVQVKFDRKHLTNMVDISIRTITMDKLNVLSLFCGCGGLDYGFHNNERFTVVKAYDNMQYAVDTYNTNYPSTAEMLDIKQLHKTKSISFAPDIIVGGPPCQDFSVAGKKTLGERASLTETFIDIICHFKPKYFVMENVPTIRTIGKAVYDKILQQLTNENYGLTIKVVYMPDYGIPQERKRLIMIGELNGEMDSFSKLLEETKKPITSIREYIRDVDIGLTGQQHVYRHPMNYNRRGVFSIDELYPTVRGCMRKMPPGYKFHDADTCKNRDEIYMPTWQFLAKIQTFPRTFTFLNKNNVLIIGNAVPPRFSGVLAKVIAQQYESLQVQNNLFVR
jgi:DNA (cytosine-5)-methyltransferase 1